MQNSSSSFQLWAVSFDLFSHCAVSSLKLVPTLNVSGHLLKPGKVLFCLCCCACHTGPPGLQLLSTQTWEAMSIATLTHFLLHFLLSERFACVDRGWRGTKRKMLNIILLKCAKSWYWQWVGWKPTLSKEWALGKKWCDSWWFKLRSFSLQLRA